MSYISEDQPTKKLERFIIMERDKDFTAMRIVATAQHIAEQVAMLEETGRYESVVVAERV